MEQLSASSPFDVQQETGVSPLAVLHGAAATLVVGRTKSKNNNLFLIYLFLLYILGFIYSAKSAGVHW